MNAFVKVINPGSVELGGKRYAVFVRIEYRTDGELALCGVAGPRRSGSCAGSCGQIAGELLRIKRYTRGWNFHMLLALYTDWKQHHLNHMHAGCEHQDEWDVSKELAMPNGKKERAGLVRVEEHPEGLLCKPCPVCGYRYGSAWLKRDVPEAVLQRLSDLPETVKQPAWV